METIDDIEPGKVQVGIQNMAILDTFFFFYIEGTASFQTALTIVLNLSQLVDYGPACLHDQRSVCLSLRAIKSGYALVSLTFAYFLSVHPPHTYAFIPLFEEVKLGDLPASNTLPPAPVNSPRNSTLVRSFQSARQHKTHLAKVPATDQNLNDASSAQIQTRCAYETPRRAGDLVHPEEVSDHIRHRKRHQRSLDVHWTTRRRGKSE